MTELEKAARMALEALEFIKRWGEPEEGVTKRNEAITALRRALVASEYISAERVAETPTKVHEQPAQQEPVAYMNPEDLEKMKRLGQGSVAWATPTDFCTQPVYTHPQAREPLTDEQIATIRIDEEFDQWGISEAAFKYVARAIEAAHGIKGDA